MERIITFSIDIDDNIIKKKIEEQAVSKVVKSIDSEVRKNIESNFSVGTGSRSFPQLYDEMVKEKINQVIEEKQDYIIEEAIKHLTDKMYRSKKIKEAMNEVLGNFKE